MGGERPLHGVRTWPQSTSAPRLLAAILEVSGRIGYHETAVRDVLQHSGSSRSFFYRLFSDKEDCFSQAYAAAVDYLTDAVLKAAASQSDCRAAFRAALVELFAFVTTQPAIARALLIEALAAGDSVQQKRNVAIERLAQAIDAASEHSPSPPLSPLMGLLIVGAIEGFVATLLQSEDPGPELWERLGELMYFVVLPYFGEEAASEELEAPPPSPPQATSSEPWEVRVFGSWDRDQGKGAS